MVRQLTPNVRWIERCHEIGRQHEHVSLYLLSQNERNVLIDSGAHTNREEIQSILADAIGEDTVDAVVLTHADLPHSGNVPMLREVYPDIDVYCSSGLPGVVGLSDDVLKCDSGDTMSICGRDLTFIKPPLQDVGHTVWIYDERDAVLFTADGIGNYHDPGECTTLWGERESGFSSERIQSFHEHKLRWLVYVEPHEIIADIRALIEGFDPEYIAPIHGNPIPRESIDEYVGQLGDSFQKIKTERQAPS